MNIEALFSRLGITAQHHRERAEYWERVAAKARVDGDFWHEATAKGKAAAERQKAREIEAEASA